MMLTILQIILLCGILLEGLAENLSVIHDSQRRIAAFQAFLPADHILTYQ